MFADVTGFVVQQSSLSYVRAIYAFLSSRVNRTSYLATLYEVYTIKLVIRVPDSHLEGLRFEYIVPD